MIIQPELGGTMQLWVTQLPLIISSFTTLIIAYTGFRQMQKTQIVIGNKASADAEKAAGQVHEVKTQLASSSETVAGQVQEVKTQLANNSDTVHKQLQNLQRTSDDTHILVNNNMAVQLKINALLAKRLASITKDPEDQATAVAAEQALSEHLTKQAAVDKAIESRTVDDEKSRTDAINAKKRQDERKSDV